MKLKKKVKVFLILVLLIIIGVGGYFIYKSMSKKEAVEETKIINQIEKYGYTLKNSKSSTYKDLFKELEKILNEKEVNEEEYAKKISEMFIYDFFTLSDKSAKTDIGGVDFIHPEVLENFLKNAQNTYYKYVESNIYNNRKQSLPTVSNIEIETVEKVPFKYGEKTDEQAYKVKINWSYTDSEFSSYQKTGTLILVHTDAKLNIAELS